MNLYPLQPFIQIHGRVALFLVFHHAVKQRVIVRSVGSIGKRLFLGISTRPGEKEQGAGKQKCGNVHGLSADWCEHIRFAYSPNCCTSPSSQGVAESHAFAEAATVTAVS
jgi:hypothetical protein